MFEKRKTNYSSDIDKFLNEFDKNNGFSSQSQKKEIEKSNDIKKLRD